MTLVADRGMATRPRLALERPTSAELWLLLDSIGLAAALLGLGYALLHSGGRDAGAATVATVLALPAVFLGRAWRRAAPIELAACAAIPLAAILVPLMTPLALSNVADLNVYFYAPVLYLGLRGYVIDSKRRRLLMIGLLILGVFEIAQILPAWRGHNSTTAQVIGTFFWHNAFGAFSASIATFALAVAVWSDGPERLFSAIVAATFLATTVLSTSRASELLLALAVACLVAVTAIRRDARSAATLGVVLLAGFGVFHLFTDLVAGPGGALTHAVTAPDRNFGGSEASRLYWWTSALKLFATSPIASHGFGSFALLGPHYAPTTAPWSRWAHSGPLQALADGGLLLGLPVLAITGAMALAFIRVVGRAARQGARVNGVRLGAAVGGLVLLAHACLDFDWQYPVLFALPGVMLVLVLPAHDVSDREHTSIRRNARLRLPAVALVTLVAASSVGAWFEHAYWENSNRLTNAYQLVASGHQAGAVESVGKGLPGWPPDPRPAAWIVVEKSRGITVPLSLVRRALADSRGYASVDSDFARAWRSVDTGLASPTRP